MKRPVFRQQKVAGRVGDGRESRFFDGIAGGGQGMIIRAITLVITVSVLAQPARAAEATAAELISGFRHNHGEGTVTVPALPYIRRLLSRFS